MGGTNPVSLAGFSGTSSRAVVGEQLGVVFGAAWAGWIQARQEDWDAIANLAKVELVFQRVVAAAPGFERGRGQLYLACGEQGDAFQLAPRQVGRAIAGHSGGSGQQQGHGRQCPQ